MTPTDDEIRSLLEAEAKVTPGPWQWTTTGPMTHAEAVAWFEKQISFGDTGEQHGVGCPTHPLTVIGDDPMRPDHMVEAATTGNGPNSANNAKFLVAAREFARPLAEEVLRLRAEVASLTAERDAEEGKADEWMTANAIMDDHFVPCGQLENRIVMVLNEAADMRIANEKLEAEVAKMRALLVDVDKRGIEHTTRCLFGLNYAAKCSCNADDLQRRINEVTT